MNNVEMNPRMVVFDFDGVVLESFQVKTVAFYRLLLPWGEEAARRAVAHHTANGGISRFVKIPLYFREYAGVALSDTEVDEQCLRYSTLVEDAVIQSPPVPGVVQFLTAQLELQRPCAVLTGTPQPEMVRILDALDYSRFFTAVYGSPADKYTLFGRLFDEQNLAAEQLLFFGDSINDWEPAQKHGVPFIGRAADPRHHPFPAQVPVISDFFDRRLAPLFESR